MAKFNVSRFADPDVLKTISPQNLYDLLAPYAGYLAGRGVTLRAPARLRAVPDDFGVEDVEVVDYEILARVLANPDADVPGDLVNALYLISESCTPSIVESLLMSPGVQVGASQEQSAADIATQALLRAPYLLERLHAQQFVGARQSFRYYLTRELPSGPVPSPSEEVLEDLQRDLASSFESRKMGTQVRVLAYPSTHEVLFLVRHGEGFRRQSVQQKGRSTSVFFRPEKHDIVAYTHSIGELRINAEERERELYRRAFGRHLFADESYFPEKNSKYSLEPLRQGRSSISCADVDGIEWVVLKEIRSAFGGSHNEMKTHSADDLFAALEDRGGAFPGGKLIGARFEVRFSDARTPRIVHINPPARAKFTRDSDGARIAEWLVKRGFDVSRRENDEES